MWMVLGWMLILMAGSVRSEPQVPCFFIFGDSLVDNGNNNNMASIARANYAPYGLDFPAGPTGRFCNGRTTIDVITELLGFENYIPPYYGASGRTLLGGVNFASAAAGIRSETGQQLGDRIDFAGQVRNYRNVVSEVINLLGNQDAAARHLSKCIYSVGIGSNDYLNNYFMPTFYTTGNEYTPQQYADNLIRDYVQQLTMLYNYGARKVAVIGIGMVGCAPNVLARFSDNGITCVDRIDSAIQLFNNQLVSVVNEFNGNFPGAKFTFLNPYNMMIDILRNPARNGFANVNNGCCGVGRNNAEVTCLPYEPPCFNRNQYVFWDAFHPTEAANMIFGRRSYRAQSSNDSHPVDIETLAGM